MSKIKSQIPDPVKQLYHSVRSSIHSSDRLLDLLYDDTLVINTPEGSIEFDTSSMTAKRWFYPRYRDGSMHEPVVSQALIDVIDIDSVFFDVGANVGFYTVLGSNICSEVHAFEMDPRLASIVSTHFNQGLNEATEVYIVPSSVGEASGRFINFTPHQAENLSTNSIDVNYSGLESSSKFQIQTTSLDDYVNKSGVQPDVLKIDVEGFELSVLNGLAETIDNVQALLVEIHPDLLSQYGSNANEVLDLLDQYGFKTEQFTDHRSKTSPEDSLEPVNKRTSLQENGVVLCTR